MAEDSDTALYEQVARSVEHMIHSGTLRAGDKVPSVRRASEQHGVSVTTVVQAYLLLEDRGLIEARPKSGFYVRAQMHHPVPPPEVSRPRSAVTAVSVGGLQSRLFQATRLPGVISFGNAAPAPELLPAEKLNRILASVSRRAGNRGVSYAMPPGALSLRREIARRLMNAGSQLSPNEIITTAGGTEALILCLRALASPGDIIAVESPTYFGVLHVFEALKLRAVEIPMHPDTGMDLEALEKVLHKQKLAACVSVPNFNNPLGSLMPDANKERLVRMLAQHDVPLIEDDIFGELYYGEHRPRVAQSYDETQNVILYGSFSKTLAPGYRVGWVAPGRYHEQIQTLKLISTLATATLPELAIAEFLATGGYDHYLRTARRTYEGLVERVSNTIATHFPQPVKMTQPKGGFLLWVELPPTVDALKLDDLALEEKISIAPGPMFSAKQGFRNFIRISCANAWTPKIEKALIRLGALVKRLM